MDRIEGFFASQTVAVEMAWHLFIYVPFVVLDDNIRKRLSGQKRVARQPRYLVGNISLRTSF